MVENCPELFKPKFYRRYADLFLLFENPNQVTPFFNYLNSQHSDIKFTMEKEAYNQLIVRSNNKFCTCVCRKHNFTGLGLKLWFPRKAVPLYYGREVTVDEVTKTVSYQILL